VRDGGRQRRRAPRATLRRVRLSGYRWFRVVALAFLVALASGLRAHVATACGVFVQTKRTVDVDKNAPYLAVERVLVAWDEATGTEDFVREARFERSNQSFGFVVPVPTRPAVFPVSQAPWSALAGAFPFIIPPPKLNSRRMIGGIGGGGAFGSPDAEWRPTVLSEQRIGSFTAFVLAANDAQGLSSWMKDNGFGVSPEGGAWLDHYVHLGFYYVAFRYDAPAEATPGMTSETVRIRFTTPAPYYPYLEPKRARVPHRPRDLQVWVASQHEYVPIASRTRAGEATQRERPWQTTGPVRTSATELRRVMPPLAEVFVGDAATPWIVSPFRDGKDNRNAWGDVLFVPKDALAVDDDAIAERWPLLPVLDPVLEGSLEKAPLTEELLALPPASRLVPLPPHRPRPLPATDAALTPGTSASTEPHPARDAGEAAQPPETPPKATSGRGCALAPREPDGASSLGGGLACALLAWLFVKRRSAIPIAALFIASGGCKHDEATATPIAVPDATAVEKPGAARSAPTPDDAATHAASSDAATSPDAADVRARERAALALLFGRSNASALPLDAQLRLTEQYVEVPTPAGPPEPSRPRGNVSIGAATFSGAPSAQADGVLRGLTAGFRACYSTELATNRRVSGTVPMTVVIAPNGEVTSAEGPSSADVPRRLVTCLASKLRAAQFEPGGPSPVTMRFSMILTPPPIVQPAL